MEPFPYRIERMTDAHIPHVQALFAQVMGKKVTLEYIRTKYDTRYTGCQYMSCLAFDGGQAVAFYGTIPQWMEDSAGNRVLACHGADIMTLPNYQRKGLYRQLNLVAYEWMRDAGAVVTYGFHSEASYQSNKKLDWQEGLPLKGFRISCAKIPLAKLWRKLPLIAQLHRRQIQRTMHRHAIPSATFENSQKGNGLSVVYSPAFFASKSFHQHYFVSLMGVKFWLSIDAVIRVGDAVFQDAEHLMAGLQALRRLAKGLGFGEIQFQTYVNSPLDQALSKAYQGFDSWRLGHLVLQEGFDFGAYRPCYADQDSF